jgi:hypothetical protein
MTEARDPFDEILSAPLPPIATAPATVPAKIRKRREKFVQFPMWWAEKLVNTRGKVWYVAVYVLHLDWKNDHKPFRLANGMLKYDGVSRYTKWRALSTLERLGLILIDRHSGKSPTIRVHLKPGDG